MNDRFLKGVGVLVAGSAFFFAGYRYASALYGEDISALREDYASRALALEEKYREKERDATHALVSAWEERDKALARVDALSADVDRVRREADSARRRLSSAGTTACESERKQLSRCAGLLERGGQLLSRGVELSARAAVDKDAIVKMIQ